MLFNPKWEKTPDNCEITLRNFQKWVDAQRPNACYEYMHKLVCAVGLWLQAIDHHMLLRADWSHNPVLNQADTIAGWGKPTFGALSKRLRALAERPF